MVKSKKVLTAGIFAGACALGIFATASLAAGPIMLGGPSPATVSVPRVLVTSQAGVTLETKALAAYRQLRSFWLSRAIVR